MATDEEKSIGKNGGMSYADKPWLALRGSVRFVGDPLAPAVSEDETVVLQKEEGGMGSYGHCQNG